MFGVVWREAFWVRSAGVLLAMGGLVGSFSGQAALVPQTLVLNQQVGRTIRGDETQAFRFSVKAGQFARVEVEQDDIDVSVALYSPEDKLVTHMNSSDRRLGVEAVSCVAEKGGVYQVEVAAYGGAEVSGSYTVKLVATRTASANDKVWLDAERHLAEGTKYFSEKNLQPAVTEFEAAAAIWHKLGDATWETSAAENAGRVLILLGNARYAEADYEAARVYYAWALDIGRRVKSLWVEDPAVYNMGLVSNALLQFEKARDYFEESLVIRRGFVDRRGEASTLNRLGDIYGRLDQFERSKTFYEQQLVIERELRNRKGEGEALDDLGIAYNSLGQFDSARDFFNKALAIRRELKDQPGIGQTLNNLGDVYKSLAQFQKSIDNYAQSLAVRREINDRRGEGATLAGMGNVYVRLGQYEKGRECYEQSLAIRREVKDLWGEALTLTLLGNVYNSLLEYEKARDYYEQGLAKSREVKDRWIEAGALNNLGDVHLGLQQYEKARDYFEQSLALSHLVKDPWLESLPITGLGNAYKFLGQLEKAKDYYQQSLAITRQIKDRSGEAANCWNLLVLSQKLNEPRPAIFYGKQAVNVFQEMRGNIRGLDRDTQKSFLATHVTVYRRLSDILISEERFAEAQAVLDLLKEEEFDQLSRSGEDADTVPYNKAETVILTSIDALVTLRAEQNDLDKLQRDLGDKFPADKAKRFEQVSADIKAANVALEKSLAALGQTDASVRDQVADIKSERNLQSALQFLGKEQRSGVVALYTVIGTEEEKDAAGKAVKDKTRSKFGWVILVTANDRKAYPIDVKDLEKNVFDLRTALSHEQFDPQPFAEKIYNAIFRQTSDKQKVTLEADLNALLGKYPDKTLMWSLDGVLRYIPMAALHDGKGYLVEKYRNIVFTKESLLSLKDMPKKGAETLGLGVSAGNAELNLRALPGVDKELADIIRQSGEKTGILSGSRKLNAGFSKRAILNLKDGDNPFQRVHIASHYVFNSADQTASYLLIGDGKLTFGDMNAENNLFGTVDLLTLSACDTAMSANGKESEGFAYLAQSLGAKSVMASLWKVSDAGTPELMIRFYKLLADNPTMAKGDAFRRAQLSLLTGTGAQASTSGNASPTRSDVVNEAGQPTFQPFVKDAKRPFAHPYYWAPFVLIGNWR